MSRDIVPRLRHEAASRLRSAAEMVEAGYPYTDDHECLAHLLAEAAFEIVRPAEKLRFDESGRSTAQSWTVRYPSAPGDTAITLTIALAAPSVTPGRPVSVSR